MEALRRRAQLPCTLIHEGSISPPEPRVPRTSACVSPGRPALVLTQKRVAQSGYPPLRGWRDAEVLQFGGYPVEVNYFLSSASLLPKLAGALSEACSFPVRSYMAAARSRIK